MSFAEKWNVCRWKDAYGECVGNRGSLFFVTFSCRDFKILGIIMYFCAEVLACVELW